MRKLFGQKKEGQTKHSSELRILEKITICIDIKYFIVPLIKCKTEMKSK